MATNVLKKVLEPLAYQNLDDLDQFKNKLTTTEFLAKYIHDCIREALKGQVNGSLKVTLGESHVAWAAYRGSI